MAVTSTTSATSTASTGSTTTKAGSTDLGANTEAADRFLKLLVAQMQNQDPMSPMDNAQVTSQIAQINMVTGIDTLNNNVTSLSNQFTQMQVLQGASLVGKDVIVEGNSLSVVDKVGQGGFVLDTPADSVKVDILDKTGKVVDTLDLKKKDAGQGSFDWDASKQASTEGYTFKIRATAGGSDLKPTSLMRDTVDAVSASGDSLTLQLAKSGSKPYADVKAFN